MCWLHFNLCFTFVLAGTISNTYDVQILARATHSPDIHFSQLVVISFIWSTQDLHTILGIWHHTRDRIYCIIFNSSVMKHQVTYVDFGMLVRFNYLHSSCRNVIERAFGILKNRWKIFDRMPNYPFPSGRNYCSNNGYSQLVVSESCGWRAIHEGNDRSYCHKGGATEWLRWNSSQMNASEKPRSKLDRLSDYMAQLEWKFVCIVAIWISITCSTSVFTNNMWR